MTQKDVVELTGAVPGSPAEIVPRGVLDEVELVKIGDWLATDECRFPVPVVSGKDVPRLGVGDV